MHKLATLCYIKNNGKTLMVHRIKKQNDMHEGKWNGLGGKIESDETPEECIIREVQEETGITIIDPILKGRIKFLDLNPEIDNKMHVYIFIADKFEGSLISDSVEGTLAWIDDSKLFDLNLWEGDRVFMKWLDQTKFFSAKFIYNNNKLSDHKVYFY